MDNSVGGTVALNTGDAGLIRSDIVVGDILVLLLVIVMVNNSLVDTMVP